MDNPTQTVPLEVHGLTKKFGDFTAVDHVSFTVQPGEVLGLSRSERERKDNHHPHVVRFAHSHRRNGQHHGHRCLQESRNGSSR